MTTKPRRLRMIVTVEAPPDMNAAAVRRAVRNRLELITVADEPVEVRAVQPMPRPAMFPARAKYQARQGVPPLLAFMGAK